MKKIFTLYIWFFYKHHVTIMPIRPTEKAVICHEQFKPSLDGTTYFFWWLTFKNSFRLVDSFLHYHDYSNATIWQMYAKDHFLDIGDFPNDVSIFKKYLKELRNIFQISDWLVRKAQDRWVNLVNYKYYCRYLLWSLWAIAGNGHNYL